MLNAEEHTHQTGETALRGQIQHKRESDREGEKEKKRGRRMGSQRLWERKKKKREVPH